MEPVDYTEYEVWVYSDGVTELEHKKCYQDVDMTNKSLQDLIDWANEHADKCPRENGARAVEDRPL